MEFTPSTLKRLLSSLCLLNHVIVLLVVLVLIKLFGIWDLDIPLTKFSNSCFLMSELISISVLLLIILIHIVCMEKCTTYLFLNLNLLHLLLLSLFIQIYGVLHLWTPFMALNTMFCSLIISLVLPRFICSNLNQKFLLNLFNSKPWLKISSLLKLRLFDQMVGVSIPLLNSRLIFPNEASFTKFHVHILPNKMV